MTTSLLNQITKSIVIKHENEEIEQKNYTKLILNLMSQWDLDNYPIYMNKDNIIITSYENIDFENHKKSYIFIEEKKSYTRINQTNIEEFIKTLTDIDNHHELENYLVEKYRNFKLKTSKSIKFLNQVISPNTATEKEYNELIILIDKYLYQKDNKKRKSPPTTVDFEKLDESSKKLFKTLNSEYIPFVMNIDNDSNVPYEVIIHEKIYTGSITFGDMKQVAKRIKSGEDVKTILEELQSNKKRTYNSLNIKKLNLDI